MMGRILFRVMTVPGHTPWCTLIYHERDRIAFSGDFLLKGISSNALCQRPDVVPKGYKSLKAYTASLERVRDMDLRLVLPGHGDVIERPHDEVKRLIAHRLMRERKVIDAFAVKNPATLDELLPVVYSDTPAKLHPVARRSLHAHLIKLVEDDRVVEAEAGWLLRG